MNKDFRARFKELRKANKLTQKQVADAVGSEQVSVSQWESGRCKPSSEMVLALAELFKVNANWMMTGRGFRWKPATPQTAPLSPIMQKLMQELAQLSEDEQRRELQSIQEKNELRELRKLKTGTGSS